MGTINAAHRSAPGLARFMTALAFVGGGGLQVPLGPDLLELGLADLQRLELAFRGYFVQGWNGNLAKPCRPAGFSGARKADASIGKHFDLASLPAVVVQFAVEKDRLIGRGVNPFDLDVPHLVDSTADDSPR